MTLFTCKSTSIRFQVLTKRFKRWMHHKFTRSHANILSRVSILMGSNILIAALILHNAPWIKSRLQFTKFCQTSAS